jgi:hypothetical protein
LTPYHLLAFNRSLSSEQPGGGLAIVEQSAVERLATLLEREVALEAVARELLPGKELDELIAELEQLRAVIKALKSE